MFIKDVIEVIICKIFASKRAKSNDLCLSGCRDWIDLKKQTEWLAKWITQTVEWESRGVAERTIEESVKDTKTLIVERRSKN